MAFQDEGCVNGTDRHIATLDIVCQESIMAGALYFYLHDASRFALERSSHLFFVDFFAGEGLVVNGYDTVARFQSDAI